jgi:hypothetical protein
VCGFAPKNWGETHPGESLILTAYDPTRSRLAPGAGDLAPQGDQEQAENHFAVST